MIFDLILISLLVYFAFYLMTMAWFGLVTQSSMVHRCPYAFHRPTVYLLVVGLLVLDTVLASLGQLPAIILFSLLMLDLIYETIHPLISHSVEITSASSEALQKDLVDVFQKLKINFSGKYPKYTFPDEKARLKVKYWPKLGEAEIIIYPRSKVSLLLMISKGLEVDFQRDEGDFEIRGYLLNLLVALGIFVLVIWKFTGH